MIRAALLSEAFLALLEARSQIAFALKVILKLLDPLSKCWNLSIALCEGSVRQFQLALQVANLDSRSLSVL